MVEEPRQLTDQMLDGSERMRLTRKMRDAAGERTGPLKVWTTSISDILRFARRIAPAVKALAITSRGLSYTDTADKTTELGMVPIAPAIVGEGTPDPAVGSFGQFYLDKVSGDLYQKGSDDGVG